MMGRGVAGVRCSFCGKAQDRVRRVIAGPGVYICNECVELCSKVLSDDTGNAGGWVTKSRSARRAWWARLFRIQELQPER